MDSDGPGLHGYLSRPEAVEYEPYGPVGPDEADDLARQRAADQRFWAVQTAAETLVGNLYLAPSGPEWWQSWELGYVFHPYHWGQGYATEACQALLDAVFDDGAHRVVAHCDPANLRSWALLERLGMRREGHSLRAAAFVRDPSGRPLAGDPSGRPLARRVHLCAARRGVAREAVTAPGALTRPGDRPASRGSAGCA
ncbi:GNAT family N-acetyltransferase [Actinotalea sp. K2]|uniref:GNAT family N-acetyltransferase n=1 Tax=Actinotalea sp. K2 TaxID=2939438 RepID=UPI0020178E47|nr:GNAT family N-acetyltransferase [Actinotalea sp. K2]MCL3861158.1 GNAT family N-acetyltransferase [Actinotalea sp. K2]